MKNSRHLESMTAGPPGPTSAGGSDDLPGVSGRSLWIVAAPAVLVCLALALRFSAHLVDDAYISFRYARNLAAGHGLVYNLGERVEGYTNFLWVLLLDVGMKLGQDPETFARLLGWVCTAALVLAVTRFASRNLTSRAALWIAPALCAVHPAISVWAGGGLEGPLFALLLTCGVCLAALSADAGSLRPTSAVFLALAALTRPEGLFAAAVVAAAILLACPQVSRRSVAIWAGTFLALWIPHFIWRWAYYGNPLPNTFYAKVDVHGSEIRRGLVYLHSFVKDTGYWLLLPIAGAAFAPRRRPVLVVAAVTAAYIGFIVFVGGDTLCMYRFFVPVIGLLGILTAWGAEGWRRRLRPRPWVLRSAIVLMAAAVAYTMIPSFAGPRFDSVRTEIEETATWKEIGLWFGRNANRGESIAVLPAGAIPYFSGLQTIDMLGLNDAVIAHAKVPMGRGEAGHEKYDLAYVLRRSPTYVVVGVYNLSPQPLEITRMLVPYYPIEQALLSSEDFVRHYRAHMAQTPHGYFIYFKRNA